MTAQDYQLSARVRVMQIIAGAMVLAIFALGGVMIALAANSPAPPQEQPPLITYIALGVTGLASVMSILVPNLLAASIVQRSALQSQASGEGAGASLLGAYQTTLIVGLALCEGPAILCLIAYFVERNALALGGAGVAVLIMLVRFPTEGRVRDWIRSCTGRG
jgi:hypothetical protein